MSAIGFVRVWHFGDEWGVVDSDDTPGGAYVRGYSLRVEAVADLNEPGVSMGLRPGTEVEFEWSETAQPVEGLLYLVEQAWPRGTARAEPARQTGAFSTSLWNSVGDPDPDGLTVMREVDPASLEIPAIKPPVVFTTVGTVRLWADEEGWGVIDSDDTPGGAWAHFSVVAGTGFRSLQPGQAVEFTYEHAEQDGHSFRAVSVKGL
ncbi:cold-shock protein [Williamsia sp. D3]|uniref:cold-shock protein n=1 Tax=Williamsia sp. D3 TaxID=1313067 RepID=UPI0004065DFC|nr:cold shock domain-containing protein [Williamsia sp. D3]